MRLATLALGTEAEWALRLPSLAAGILCIPAAFLLGRAAHSARMGLLFATLVAFDPVLVTQARTARMYSLLALLILVSVWLLTVLVRRGEGRPWQWAGLGLVWAAAFWTHMLGLLLWLAIPAALLRTRDRRLRRGVAISAAVASAIGLFALVAPALSAASPRRHPVDLGEAARLALERAAAIYLPAPAGIVLIGAALLGLYFLGRRSRSAAFALGAIAIAGALAVVIAARDRPYGVDRYLIPYRLSVHAGLAALAASVPAGAARVAAAVLVTALSAHLAWQALPRELPRANEVGAVARSLRPGIESGDGVTYLPNYLFRTGRYYGLPFDPRIRPPRGLPPGERFDRTWVVVAHPSALPTSMPGRFSSRALAHQTARMDRLLTALADDYGVRYDGRALARRLASRSLAVGIDREGIRILTAEPRPRTLR